MKKKLKRKPKKITALQEYRREWKRAHENYALLYRTVWEMSRQLQEVRDAMLKIAGAQGTLTRAMSAMMKDIRFRPSQITQMDRRASLELIERAKHETPEMFDEDSYQ